MTEVIAAEPLAQEVVVVVVVVIVEKMTEATAA